jgi:hypothetical protein
MRPLTLDPARHGLTDDGRRWWAVQGNVWAAPWMVAARLARSAVAELKRDMFNVETRSNGWSHREARLIIQTQDVTCVGGPYTTPEAFDLDVRWRLACEIANRMASITTALSPISTLDDCWPWLTEDTVAGIIDRVADMYRRNTNGRHP